MLAHRHRAMKPVNPTKARIPLYYSRVPAGRKDMNNNFALEDMAIQLDIIKNKLWVTLEDLREECFNSRNVLPDSVLKS